MKTFTLLLFGLLSMTLISSAAAETTGASAAFTSRDSVVLKALDLIKLGKLSDAQSLLAADDGSADSRASQAREELKDIIHRIRIEYSTDADKLLEKLRKSIPDVTKEDLDRWTKAGEAQFKTIDGQIKYFNREPSNIFRFCEQARERREKAAKNPAEDERWKLTDHLKQVIAAAASSSSPQVTPIKHKVTYTLTIPAHTPAIKPGSVVRVWLPYPQEYRQQRDVKLLATNPPHQILSPGGIDGREIAGAAQRTIYFEQRVTDITKPLTFQEVFQYTSCAYYPILDPAKAQPLPDDFNERYLSERPPHIVFTPQLRETVKTIVGSELNALNRVRAIFNWIDANIKYHAEDEYGTISSFAGKCFTCKRGDCGIQSTLFITMCRIAGVPARWQSGWESKPIGWNMHDWAEFYVAPWGWLPADPSYGLQKSDDPRVRDFYIGHQDSYRMIVNLDYGADLFPTKSSFRSEPADFQRGEVEVDGKNLYFDQWDYDMTFEREPGPNF